MQTDKKPTDSIQTTNRTQKNTLKLFEDELSPCVNKCVQIHHKNMWQNSEKDEMIAKCVKQMLLFKLPLD